MHNHRVGWVVVWNDDYKSAMPDEATALQCAAAPALAEALRELLALWQDLGKSNPGFMAKLTLQDYARMNEAPGKGIAALNLAGVE